MAALIIINVFLFCFNICIMLILVSLFEDIKRIKQKSDDNRVYITAIMEDVSNLNVEIGNLQRKT